MGYRLELAETGSRMAFLDCDLLTGNELGQFQTLPIPFDHGRALQAYVVTVFKTLYIIRD